MNRLLAFLLITLCFAGTGFSETFHVPDDFPTIQDALLSFDVVDGDRIIVRAGTYFENINFIGKAVTLMSEEGPGRTVIDGSLATCVVNFENWEGPDTVLAGFTITNGAGKPC